MPVDPISITTVIASLLATATKTIQQLDSLVGKYKDAPLTMVSLQIECSAVKSSLSFINLIIQRDPTEFNGRVINSTAARETFDVVLTSCTLVFGVAESKIAILTRANEKSVIGSWKDKLRTVWKENEMNSLLDRIRGVRDTLNLLLSISQSESTAKVLHILQSERTKVKSVREGMIDSRIAEDGDVRSFRPPSIFSNIEDESKEFTFDGDVLNTDVYRKAFMDMRKKLVFKEISEETELNLEELSLEEQAEGISQPSEEDVNSAQEEELNNMKHTLAISPSIKSVKAFPGGANTRWSGPPSKRLTKEQLSERLGRYFQYQKLLFRADQLRPTPEGLWSDPRLGSFRNPEDNNKIFIPPKTQSLHAILVSLKEQGYMKPTTALRLDLIDEDSLFSLSQGQPILDQALITACYRSSLQVTNIVLQLGANIDCKDKANFQLTPLMIAVIQGHSTLACHLIEWGALLGCESVGHKVFPHVLGRDTGSSKGPAAELETGLDALSYILLLEKPIALPSLKEYYANSPSYSHSRTPFEVAVLQGDLSRCKELERLRKWTTMEDDSVLRILRSVARTNHTHILLWLLQDPRAVSLIRSERHDKPHGSWDRWSLYFLFDVYGEKWGPTTLTGAIEARQYENVQLLIAEGADISLYEPNSSAPGPGVFHFVTAWPTENERIINALLEGLDIKTFDGILHLAAHDLWQDIDAQCRLIKRFIELGASISGIMREKTAEQDFGPTMKITPTEYRSYIQHLDKKPGSLLSRQRREWNKRRQKSKRIQDTFTEAGMVYH